MRITGLATGLDMDEIIKNSMKPYRIKVDQMTQKKDVVEIKQKLYRDVIKDNTDFFNKHLDIVKSDSLLKSSNYKSVSFTSSDEGAVTVKAQAGAKAENYSVNIKELATSAKVTLKGDDIKNADKISLKITVKDQNGNPVKNEDGTIKQEDVIVAITNKELDSNGELSSKAKTELVENLNKALKGKGSDVTAQYSEFSKGIVFETKALGREESFSLVALDSSDNSLLITSESGNKVNALEGKGKSAEIEIMNSRGDIYTHEGNSNTVTLDNVAFTFNNKSLDGNAIRITGKTDAKELKDKIVAFVNDYNKLIEKMNTTVSTKHDRSYNPLTADQKKDMSENEIKLWNEKVEKGQLYRDSDITRIANSMKESMRTLMEDSGLKLEKVGIKPVEDYSGSLNGTFTIDEDALTTALENNTENVMKLFTTPSPTEEELAGLSSEEIRKRKNQTGILFKLKDTIDVEFRKSTSSPLLKKAGFEGTSTFSTNELSKNITNYEKKIKDMEKSFSRREQALYSKYATLEKMMNKLNSQQSNLMSQLGMN
ncbi:flagellar filament capping protein FliD [Clostridium sp. ZBS15]|uniref:flagellar filament capping protein FliD n=1 Tax=Clostridium sp. ZBS15 TaxID=2949969 RepID=UPI002079719E|nr:flagellar filament capping protein FliD [Clostridium sp. ZBS15]